jgi:hypothetical protein
MEKHERKEGNGVLRGTNFVPIKHRWLDLIRCRAQPLSIIRE